MAAPTAQEIKERMVDEQPVIGRSRFARELDVKFDEWLNDYARRSVETSRKARFEMTDKDRLRFRDTPIRQLIDDPYFLGLEDDMYPIHKQELELVIDLWLKGEIEEVHEIAAMGVGKTFKAGALIFAIVYYTLIEPDPAALYGLDKDTKLGIVVMSRTGDLAKEVTFQQLLPFFDCGFFNDYFPPQIDISRLEQKRRFPTKLEFPRWLGIFPGTGSAETLRGRNVPAALLDEFAYMDKVVKSRRNQLTFGGAYDAAEDAYRTITNRMFTRSPRSKRRPLLMAITSPRTRHEFAEERFEQGRKHPLAPQTIYNPELDENKDVVMTDTGIPISNKTGNIMLDSISKGLNRKAISLRRKPLWRGRPSVWKGVKIWTGLWLPFDVNELVFISEVPKDGLFDDDRDYDANGHLKVPIEALQYFIDSPETALRDIGGVASGSINKFFRETAKLKLDRDLVNYLIYDPSSRNYYPNNSYYRKSIDHPDADRYIHIDIGVSHDACGIACCYVKGWKSRGEGRAPIIGYDFHQQLRAPPGKTFRLQGIADLIDVLVTERDIPIALITFDQYQSLELRQQIFDEHNIPCGKLSIDRTNTRCLLPGKVRGDMQLYQKLLIEAGKQGSYGAVSEGIGNNYLAPWIDFRQALYDERIHISAYTRKDYNLLTQMDQEEFYAIEEKIDHPPKGEHDGLQAVVGAYFNCVNNEWYGAGEVLPWEEDTYDAFSGVVRLEELLQKAGVDEVSIAKFMQRGDIITIDD